MRSFWIEGLLNCFGIQFMHASLWIAKPAWWSIDKMPVNMSVRMMSVLDFCAFTKLSVRLVSYIYGWWICTERERERFVHSSNLKALKQYAVHIFLFLVDLNFKDSKLGLLHAIWDVSATNIYRVEFLRLRHPWSTMFIESLSKVPIILTRMRPIYLRRT